MSYKDEFEWKGSHISPEENIDIKIHEINALFEYLKEKWLEMAIRAADGSCRNSANALRHASTGEISVDCIEQYGYEIEVGATYEDSPSCSCCDSTYHHYDFTINIEEFLKERPTGQIVTDEEGNPIGGTE